MIDLKTALLSRILAAAAAELESDGASGQAWADARRALEATGEEDPDLAAAIEAEDLAALRAILDQWASGKRLLPAQDRAVLKRAMKAYRKSFKVTRLADESKGGGGPLSGGAESGIVGITPPPQYPREVWDELVRQGRLVDARHGMYELPRE